MKKEYHNPETLFRPGNYSHVVTVEGGRLVLISGQIALNQKGELVGKSDLAAQAEQVFENLRAALEAAGATFDDVIKLAIYIADYKPEDRQTLARVRDRYISKENPPTSTLIGVSALALPGLLLEIEAMAVIE